MNGPALFDTHDWLARFCCKRMTPSQAIAFVRRHGVVLEAAKGMEPSLAAWIAGGAITGSWWGHPKGHEIYALTQAIEDSQAVLVCMLARKRRTYIHRRLWPAFVHMADRFPPHALDKVTEVHLPSGRHKRVDVPLAEWLPHGVMRQARQLPEEDAVQQIGVWLRRYALLDSD